jgi:hypothetical protein
MDRVGARIWIARIMISWGVISGAMAFIPQIAAWTGFSPEHTFYGLRFLLGLAEAGFFPGIIFFLTLGFLPPTAPGSSAVSWLQFRSLPRSARQCRRRSSAFIGRAALQAGNDFSSSRRCPRSFSPSSPIFI